MSQVRFRIAHLEDIERLMAFMGRHWRQGHVLSRRRDMWAWEFGFHTLAPDLINVAVAEQDDALVGIFGWMPYNQRPIPDLAGSLWKVVDDVQAQAPMLGLKLRRYVMEQVPHRFFAAPGAGPQTRPIYGLLGMQWQRMQQFYRINPAMTAFELLQNVDPEITGQAGAALPQARLEPVESIDQLHDLPWHQWHNLWPYRDAAYIRWRFWDYPFADYDLWMAYGKDNTPSHLLVTRTQCVGARCALRIVTILGHPEGLASALVALFTHQVKGRARIEYMDCICHGVPASVFSQAGMAAVDFDQPDAGVVVPNYFEPFCARKVPVYCVADPLPEGVHYVQYKGDGDQDRPNLLEEEA